MKKILLTIYFLFRLPFLYLLKILFKASSGKPEKIGKILIVRIDRIGDFVLTLPVIDNVRLTYPDAHISILVRPYLKGFAVLVKEINKTILYENKIKTARQIRKEKYDMAIDMMCDYRFDSAFLTFISGAPLRAGFAGGFREVLFNYSVNPLENRNKDMVQLNLELLKPLGIPAVITVPHLAGRNNDTAGDMVIAIHPGGYYETQRWSADKFILLGKKIMCLYRVTLFIVDAKNHAELVNHIVSGIHDVHAKAALTGVEELVFLLSGCALFIGNNSGPLHLACALGVPTISIMGPTDPVLWQPKGENNTVIRKNLECSPCAKAKCAPHSCMDSITVEEVCEAVKNRIEKIDGIERYRKDSHN